MKQCALQLRSESFNGECSHGRVRFDFGSSSVIGWNHQKEQPPHIEAETRRTIMQDKEPNAGTILIIVLLVVLIGMGLFIIDDMTKQKVDPAEARYHACVAFGRENC